MNNKKTCKQCGKSFETKIKNKELCTPECQRKWKNTAFLRNKKNTERKTKDRNIIYRGYKEPLTKLHSPYYGYEGVILEDEDTQEIQCCICGRWFESLAGHIRYHKEELLGKQKHLNKGATLADSYKDMFGLMRKTALVTDRVRGEIIKSYQRLPYWEKEKRKERLRKINKDNKQRRFNNKKCAEKANETERCYLQVLEIVKKTAIKLNRTPTEREVKGAKGEDLSSTIRRNYGSFGQAIKLLGLEKNSSNKLQELTRRFLIKCLSDFKRDNGRMASRSDIRSNNIPEEHHYNNEFGSFDKALELIK